MQRIPLLLNPLGVTKSGKSPKLSSDIEGKLEVLPEELKYFLEACVGGKWRYE